MRILVRLLVKIAPWHFLIASIREIGWGISVEKGEEDEIVQGLIMGTDDYIDRHTPEEVKE